MLQFIIRRILVLIPLVFVISILVFIVIQLPPGDFLTVRIMTLASSGTAVSDAEIAALTSFYGLDKPLYEQYFIWMRHIFVEGDFGLSLTYTRPVRDLLAERLPLTIVVSVLSLLFVWVTAVPIGIYSATHQYSLADYLATIVGFIGLAIPPFLLALVVMWTAFTQFNITAIGLLSAEFESAPWSVPKVVDLLKHLWIPVVIIGLSGTAQVVRVMRATLLDELNKLYVVTARAKGLSEGRLLLKYPVRVAINPIVSTIGWMLPRIVSGEILVSTVLNIPTTGPLLLAALMNQDMYLAGSIVLMLSVLTVIGTLMSDILLAWLDPRIRYD